MNKVLSSLCVTGLSLLHPGPCAVAQQPAVFHVNGRTVRAAELDRQMNEMIGNSGVPGISLAVIDHNKVVYFNAYGYRDSAKTEKADSATVFQAGSLSKSLLVYVVSRLAEEKRIDLDKPMVEYLRYPLLEHDPRYKRITPRMILSHCSGIENWKDDNQEDTLEILSDPGTEFVYSGEGYIYLSKVVELILKKPYGQYVDEMVLRPLDLTTIYTAYDSIRQLPSDYAVGHDNLGKEVNKWKNYTTDPAGGAHLTARDYARLIISIFDKKHLSEGAVKTILTPIINLDHNNPDYSYGPGFELMIEGADTIVSHGGSTTGFKNLMYYSVARKCGFVYLTNSNRGTILAKKISELTAGLDLEPFFRSDYVLAQYPSYASELLKIYREHGREKMYAKIEALKKQLPPEKICGALNELGYIFLDDDKTVAKRLLEEDVALCPGSSLGFYILGHTNMQMEDYASAYKNLKKAMDLHFTLERVEPYLKICEEKMNHK